jgi:hypothetical protein
MILRKSLLLSKQHFAPKLLHMQLFDTGLKTLLKTMLRLGESLQHKRVHAGGGQVHMIVSTRHLAQNQYVYHVTPAKWENSLNLNIVLKSVLTPVPKSCVWSNFSAKEQNAAC